MSEGVGVPHAPLFACGMTYPEAAVGIATDSEARSAEHAGRVAPSRPVDIADHVGGGVLPGSAGSMITAGARG